MILYDLDRAHPASAPLIRRIVDALAERYPWAPLREVRLYEQKSGDRSMANTTEHEITLNPYWFSRDPVELRLQATRNTRVRLRGREVEWHGGMTDEPRHVLTHEFGHSLSHALPGWRALAGQARSRALDDPRLAVSGYGLVDDDEYFAEMFAAYELGTARIACARAVRDLLEKEH